MTREIGFAAAFPSSVITLSTTYIRAVRCKLLTYVGPEKKRKEKKWHSSVNIHLISTITSIFLALLHVLSMFTWIGMARRVLVKLKNQTGADLMQITAGPLFTSLSIDSLPTSPDTAGAPISMGAIGAL